MTLQEVMSELEACGNQDAKETSLNQGAHEPLFGVRIADLKNIAQKTGKDHDLALELFETGNADAMYLAGLIASEKKVTVEELNAWARKADWYMISEYAVGGLAADSPHGLTVARKWVKYKSERVASAGWATFANIVSVWPDDKLDMRELRRLLEQAGQDIKQAPNRVRYTMNQFVISTGCYVEELTDRALKVARRIGKVEVDMGGTACKVPSAPEEIEKVVQAGRVGRKRSSARS